MTDLNFSNDSNFANFSNVILNNSSFEITYD
jgi:hypothetical protein